MNIKKNFVGSLVSAGAFFVVAASVFAAGTVMISGNTTTVENTPGWMFNRDTSTATPFEFNTDQASIGQGSLYVKPIGTTAADKFIGENFINTAIANVNTISYDFMIGSGGTVADANHFYMNVYANFGVSDDNKFYDCRYNIVPTTGSVLGFTTVTFDPTQAYSVTKRGSSPFPCPAVPADMDLQSAGSNIRAFALNVGDTSVNDLGLDGYLDNVVVNLTGDVTTYDFEPILSPSTKDDCKSGGWMMFNTPVFKNQGDCVSFVQSSEKAVRNKLL